MEIGRISRRSRSLGGAMVGRNTVPSWRDVTLTNAQVKALRATPFQLVPAPGAGAFNEFVFAILVAITVVAAWTETADNLEIADGGGNVLSQQIESTGFMDQVGTEARYAYPKVDAVAQQNSSFVLHNSGDGEFGGGNAGSVLKVRTFYRVHALGSAWGTF